MGSNNDFVRRIMSMVNDLNPAQLQTVLDHIQTKKSEARDDLVAELAAKLEAVLREFEKYMVPIYVESREGCEGHAFGFTVRAAMQGCERTDFPFVRLETNTVLDEEDALQRLREHGEA